jgi:hypothetical protein
MQLLYILVNRQCAVLPVNSNSCLKLLELQKVAMNAKRCSKVAEHNRDIPNVNASLLSLLKMLDAQPGFIIKFVKRSLIIKFI